MRNHIIIDSLQITPFGFQRNERIIHSDNALHVNSEKVQRKTTASEGRDPETCRSSRDWHNSKHGKVSRSHFIVDEMKLKKVPHINVLDRVVIGFSTSSSNFISVKGDAASMVEYTLTGSDPKESDDKK